MYGNSGRMWANPQGNAGGEGGAPAEINWSDIQGKPSEYDPKPHSHALNEIRGLKETLDTIPKTVGDNEELEKKLVANTEVPTNEVSVKNSVILSEGDSIDNIPDGTIVFMLGDDHSE